ncbi:pentapeptide repeat-containing protein [Rhizobium leguminosarum]|uniref:pentapeptide repeat-containing protein n=1 Tax=Rhizobium leguminosarum TaxID=384 RepID=UPI001F1F8F60|nr:pentapeptide repeat-containing protein [Rhizobium leguminosarum]UIK19521.1 pentapeptide repeat-containing protein [Rhizobium leguminosarum]
MTAMETSSGGGTPTRLEALQQEYHHLKQAMGSAQAGSLKSNPNFETIRDFAERIVATGVGLADPDERRQAQVMLNYCTARLFALAPGDPNVKVRVIAPYAGPARETGFDERSSVASEQKQATESGTIVEANVEVDQMVTDAIDAVPTGTEGRPGTPLGKSSQAREQVRLKAMARQWRISGESDGYLLSGPALTKADPFWGKDPEITAFVSASRRKVATDRKFFRLYVAMALLLLTIVGTGWWWAPWLSRPFLILMTQQQAAEIVGTASCNEKRDANYAVVDSKKLLAIQMLSTWRISGRFRESTVCDLILTDQSLDFPLDFSGATLRWPYMQRIKGKQPRAPAKVDFSASVIEDGRFLGAVLTEANFKNCKLLSTENPSEGNSRYTSFQGASLERADFRGCQIQGVSFANTDLRDADFTDARIIGETDFTDANLAGAVFVNTMIEKPKFRDADLTNTDFRGSSLPLETNSHDTTWWLAIWSVPLDRSSYNRDDASKGNRYIKNLIERNVQVDRAKIIAHTYPQILDESARSTALATALNDWAWYCQATYGLELEQAAQLALEAQSITQKNSGNNYDPRISDTIGYINLQLGRLEEARLAYQFIEQKRAAGSLATVEPGSRYRYALVLAALGMCAEAEKVVTSLFDQKPTYSATHERVLVYLTPDRCPDANKFFSR